MPEMILIGIVGKARTGKDTVAKQLAELLTLETYAFAEPMKTMLKSVFGDHFHEGDRAGICPEAGVSYRYLMQTLGTEWGRNLINQGLWVNLVEKKWEEVKRQTARPVGDGVRGYWTPKGLVLSDVRFDSEAKWIKDRGGWLIEVVRDGAAGAGDHVSEQGLKEYKARLCIHNNGTLEQLKEVVETTAVLVSEGYGR